MEANSATTGEKKKSPPSMYASRVNTATKANRNAQPISVPQYTYMRSHEKYAPADASASQITNGSVAMTAALTSIVSSMGEVYSMNNSVPLK